LFKKVLPSIYFFKFNYYLTNLYLKNIRLQVVFYFLTLYGAIIHIHTISSEEY